MRAPAKVALALTLAAASFPDLVVFRLPHFSYEDRLNLGDNFILAGNCRFCYFLSTHYWPYILAYESGGGDSLVDEWSFSCHYLDDIEY